MKKIFIGIIGLLFANATNAQKMVTRNGEVKFEASMPAFEEVAAKNSTASSILDEATGDFVTLVLIKGFKFKAPLMEEHFNENYMESSKYPKSTFKGKILNFDASKLSANKAMYDLEGELEIHGVKKKIKTKIALSKSGGKITAVSNFSAKPQDYNIEIPNLVKSKIAENIKIAVNFVLEAK